MEYTIRKKRKKIGFSRRTCADWLRLAFHPNETPNTIVSVSLFKLVSRILYKYKTFRRLWEKVAVDYGLPIEKYKSSRTAYLFPSRTLPKNTFSFQYSKINVIKFSFHNPITRQDYKIYLNESMILSCRSNVDLSYFIPILPDIVISSIGYSNITRHSVVTRDLDVTRHSVLSLFIVIS